MWMSTRIAPALSSSSAYAFARAAVPISPLATAIGCPPRSQRLFSSFVSSPHALGPFKPKVSGTHWMVNRQHHHYSTGMSCQIGASFATSAVVKPKAPLTALAAASSSTNWSRSWITTAAVSGSIFGPMLWARVSPGYKVAYCAPPTATTANYTSPGSYPPSKEPLISTREITFGTVMGLGSGFLFKKLGKLILLVIGLGFVSLQLLSNQGYVTVHWSRFERRFKDSFDLDGDGKVTVNDAKHGFRALIDLLTKNFQFKSTFIGGFVMGFRYG